jgi:N-formylglutamate amidohydrolase
VADRIVVDDDTRRREEDPHTDRLIPRQAGSVVVHRSRFEVDLNRPRESAVYETPDDAWGLTVWREPLQRREVEQSIDEYDDFYRRMAVVLDEAAGRGHFVLLDLHSYNHRRQGPLQPPDDLANNPVVNVGTRWVDQDRWGETAAVVMDELRSHTLGGVPLDVRENVKFKGGNLTRWVNERYAGRGFALALEFKKVFMDEWTGEVDTAQLEALGSALEAATRVLHDQLLEAE